MAMVVLLGACGSEETPVSVRPPDSGPDASEPEVQEHERDAAVGDRWDGIRVDDDGRTLTVGFVGGRAYRANDPCSVRYWLDVDEQPDAVRLAVRGARPEPPSTTIAAGISFACTTEGHFRLVTTTLDEPLGDRQVVNALSGEVAAVVDGRALWRISWLPDHYTEKSHGPAWAPDGHVGWRHVHGTERAPATDRCTPGPALIEVTQHVPPTDQPVGVSAQARVVGTYDLHGTTALHLAEEGAVARSWLAWSGAGASVSVASTPACAGDAPVAVETLLRVAEEMTPPA